MSTLSVVNVVSTTVQTTEIKSNSATLPVTIENNAGVEVGWFTRAWVNFNGTNGTIRSGGNVSSVVRTNTGKYTVNFTVALGIVDYACCVSGGRDGTSSSTDGLRKFYSATSTSVLIETLTTGTSFVDHDIVALNINA